MKKSIYYIGIATLSVIGLFACQMQEEMWGKKTETEQVGILTLNVEATVPASLSTKAGEVNTDNFAVVVQGKANTDVQDVKREYAKVADVPAQVTLPIGDYVVASHTPGTLEKQLSYPYYAGEKAMTINEGTTSETTVKCTMQNSRIQMNYSDDFLNSFSAWNITVTDGSNQALYFNQTEKAPTPVYWYFGEEVKSVKVHISATTIEGNTITSERDFAKSDASEGYTDVESNNFIGGDALIIDLKPTTSLIGNVTGITVAVSIIFENHTDPVPINVTDKEPETPNTPDTPTDPETPTIGDDLSLVLPADFTIKADMSDEIIPEANAIITAKKGIKSMIVKISSTSSEFMAQLNDIEKDNNIHFVSGEELVGNMAVEQLFQNLSVNISVPQEGDTAYNFPIHSFYTFLFGLAGEHLFEISLVDNAGSRKTGTLKITMN